MRLERLWLVTLLAAGLAASAGCVGENEAAAPSDSPRAIVKGGDARTGDYDPVADWWKPAPDHQEPWTWGQVSGVAADNPDRIIVVIWGDRDAEGRERPDGSNYLVVVNRDGDIIEIDIPGRSLHVRLSEKEIRQRLQEVRPPDRTFTPLLRSYRGAFAGLNCYGKSL